MIALAAREIAGLCGGHTTSAARVTGVAIDSRAVAPGDLFVALPGTRTDGARFIADALGAGAAAVLAGGPPGAAGDAHTIVVPDPLIALGQIAGEVRRRSAARVIGVTGSTGKTSTKDILAAILGRQLATVASFANFNTEIGLPLTLCRIDPATEAVVCELGMRGMGQVAYLAEIARPDVAVITSVGPVHLELVGSVEAVAEAKAEILQALTPGDTAVVPYGEALLAPYIEMCRARVITFGEAQGADVRLAGLRSDRAEIALGGRTITVPVNFDQHHNGVNLTAAVAACVGLGLDPDDAGLMAGAGEVVFSRWRGERVRPCGRRLRDRRLLQREPGLDAGGAAPPRRGRRRPPHRRRPGRDGRARSGRRPGCTPRSAVRPRRSGWTRSWPWGRSAAPTAAAGTPTPPRRWARCPTCCAPAMRCW